MLMLLELERQRGETMSIKARFGLDEIEDYVVETVPDADIIVNANESNWNLPKDIVEKIVEQTRSFSFNRYPPMAAESLCSTIGSALNVDANKIIIGNGSSELLEKACYAFGGMGRKIAVPTPSFSMYGEYVQLADSTVLPYKLSSSGYINPDDVIELCKKERPALLIICNPNNPTGNFNLIDKIEKILAKVDCPVIMDEAYMDFAQEGFGNRNISTLSLVDKYSNFLCFRTFSKAFGLAGMRVGFGTGSEQLIKIMQKVLLPYHVNNYSLMVAECVYKERIIFESRIKLIIRGRNKMTEELKTLGFELFDSSTNFIMFLPSSNLAYKLSQGAIRGGYKLEGSNENMAGSYIFKELLAKKIMVRDFSNHPLLPGAIRLTIGTEEENRKILDAIKEICIRAEG